MFFRCNPGCRHQGPRGLVHDASRTRVVAQRAVPAARRAALLQAHRRGAAGGRARARRRQRRTGRTVGCTVERAAFGFSWSWGWDLASAAPAGRGEGGDCRQRQATNGVHLPLRSRNPRRDDTPAYGPLHVEVMLRLAPSGYASRMRQTVSQFHITQRQTVRPLDSDGRPQGAAFRSFRRGSRIPIVGCIARRPPEGAYSQRRFRLRHTTRFIAIALTAAPLATPRGGRSGLAPWATRPVGNSRSRHPRSASKIR
jgi:hypothetical protein